MNLNLQILFGISVFETQDALYHVISMQWGKLKKINMLKVHLSKV